VHASEVKKWGTPKTAQKIISKEKGSARLFVKGRLKSEIHETVQGGFSKGTGKGKPKTNLHAFMGSFQKGKGSQGKTKVGLVQWKKDNCRGKVKKKGRGALPKGIEEGGGLGS